MDRKANLYTAIVFSSLVVFYVAAGWWFFESTLLQEPLPIVKDQSLAKPLNLRIANHYEIFVEVIKPQSGTRLDILGDVLRRHPGAPVAIEWKVSTKDSVVASNIANPESEPTTDVWLAESVWRRIGAFDAAAGNYLFEARVVRDTPALSSFQTRILVEPANVKDSKSSPLVGWYFMGSIIVWYLFGPLAAVMWIVVLIRYWPFRRKV